MQAQRVWHYVYAHARHLANLLVSVTVTVGLSIVVHDIYISIHHQDGSTVDIRRLNKIYNLTKKQRMKQSSPVRMRL